MQRTAQGIYIARWGGALGAVLVVLAFIGLARAEYPPHVSSWPSVVPTLAVLLLGLGVYAGSVSLAKARIAQGLYAQGGKLLRPYTLRMSPESLRIERPGAQASVSWQEVEEIVVTPQCAFIFTAPTYAVVVPARCFASLSDYDAFVAEARSYAVAAVA